MHYNIQRRAITNVSRGAKKVVIIRGFTGARDTAGALNFTDAASASMGFSDLKKIFLHRVRRFAKKRQTS
jgi:hypothetical protein